ncbi:DEK domain-containing chromatin-associated protein 2-like isoform X2 [Wolffia australiana]
MAAVEELDEMKNSGEVSAEEEGTSEESKKEREVGEEEEGKEGEGAEGNDGQVKRKRGRKAGQGKEKVAEMKASKKKLDREAQPSAERPTRERKTVERFSSMSPQGVSATKALSIKQGSGTKLKEIPNVFYKLSKRKVDDNLKVLHSILYGQKAKALFLKRNICQFSGFVWTENKEKEKTKVKEKIDKLVKDKLLDFCDILDIPVSRATMKKEDISAKLLEFLESPHVTRDVLLAEKEEKKKKKKRKTRGKAASESKPGRNSDKEKKRQKKQVPGEPEKEESLEEYDSEEEKSGASDNDSQEDSDTKKATKSANESDEEKSNDTAPQKEVSVLKGRDKDISKNNRSAKNTTKTKQDKEKAEHTEKKKVQSGKGRSSTKTKEPTKGELDSAVRDILKEVDFNTATLADILKQLGTRFSMDLMHRKAEVKSIIEEVINDMTDDDDEPQE